MTGAAGFIGGAMARFAAQRGCKVAGIGGTPIDRVEHAALGLSRWRGGMIDPSSLEALDFQPDLVFHCAGAASVAASVSDPAGDHLRTVETTAILLSFLARRAPAARLVYPSSGAVYGAAAARVPRDPAAPLVPVSPYGRHKMEAEALVRAAGERGAQVAIVRLFSIYGPGLRKQLLWDACVRIAGGRGEFAGSGLEKRDFLEIGDAVTLLWRAGEYASPQAPTVDGGTGAGVCVRTVVEKLAALITPAPEVVFTGCSRAGDPEDMVADPTAACVWNWAPATDFETGLARYVEWFRGQG